MSTPQVTDPVLFHPIRVAARRAGLTTELIRAWEGRYRVVEPSRSPTGQRLYRDTDIERLRLLHRAVMAGRTIGQVATLSPSQLAGIVAADAEHERGPVVRMRRDIALLVRDAMTAVHMLDAERLQGVLLAAARGMSPTGLIDRVLVPLLHEIGTAWREGDLTVAHEHVATAVVRTMVGSMLRDAESLPGAPLLAVATLPEEMHEIGAMLAGATAARDGWRVIYLGTNLPVADIGAAVSALHADALAFGVTLATSRPTMRRNIAALRAITGVAMQILAGGRAAEHFVAEFDAYGVGVVRDIRAFRAALRAARSLVVAA